MFNSFKNKESLKKRISLTNINFVFALLMLFMFSLNQKIIPILILFWTLSFIFQKHSSLFFKNILNNKLSILLLVFFVLHVISLIYTKDMKAGSFDIESKLSLLVFPIIFPNLKPIYTEKFKLLIHFFIAGCIISSLICLSHSLYLILELNAPFQYITYSDLSLFLHPTYFALYLSVGIASIIHLLKTEQFLTKFKIAMYILISVFFSMMIFLLSSKAGIIVLFLLIGTIIITTIKFNRWSVAISLFFLILLSSLLMKNDRFSPLKNIVIELFSQKKEIKKTESSSERIIIWGISKNIISTNWLIGIGAGDVKDELLKEYKSIGFNVGEDKKLNAHNQFIETFLSVGIVGIILLIYLIFNLFITGKKQKNFLLMSFAIIFMINFLFESILNTQAGIVFFTFSICLFSKYSENEQLI